jgi:hypothetical protein
MNLDINIHQTPSVENDESYQKAVWMSVYVFKWLQAQTALDTLIEEDVGVWQHMAEMR